MIAVLDASAAVRLALDAATPEMVTLARDAELVLTPQLMIAEAPARAAAL